MKVVAEPETAEIHYTVECEGSQGADLHARLLRLSRHQAVIEVLTPGASLRVSEALPVFKLLEGERAVYSGRAVLSSIVENSDTLICEADLENGWIDLDLSLDEAGEGDIRSQFKRFLHASQDGRVPSELKVLLADMRMFLEDLRGWTEQLEVAVLGEPKKNRADLERALVAKLGASALPVLGMLFRRFEQFCSELNPKEAAPHAFYIKRQLHPLVLCSPFMYRTFRKPLGYAGDYEMVNMMLRDPVEGGSIFAKLLNTFFLSTPPVVAHQNRIQYLIEFLRTELTAAWAARRRARVFNIGCGPARELQELIAQSEVSNHGHFTLLDFNDETLQYTRKILTDLIQRHGRAAETNLVRKSVGQLLKEEARSHSSAIPSHYDVVYCAGLFDYIPQKLCQQLTSLFYRMLRPGGLLVVTNVAACNPSRHWMELCVDWHLVYRDAEEMRALIPAAVNRDECRLLSDESGVNSFLEVRKPINA